jgi:predicted protein tyrosine phosphatase
MKNLKTIFVLPRIKAEAGLTSMFGHMPSYPLVSICDNGFPTVVPYGDKVTDTLRLEFVDWDANRGDPAVLDMEMFGKRVGDWLVQPEHAQALVEFLKKHEDAETLVIHCYAGISRSVSIAQAVCDACGLSRSVIAIASGRSPFGSPPNHMVYATMFAALKEAFGS